MPTKTTTDILSGNKNSNWNERKVQFSIRVMGTVKTMSTVLLMCNRHRGYAQFNDEMTFRSDGHRYVFKDLSQSCNGRTRPCPKGFQSRLM